MDRFVARVWTWIARLGLGIAASSWSVSVANADVLVQPGPDPAVEIAVDIRDEHIAGGVYGSIETTSAIPPSTPNAWFYGWLVRDAAGAVGFVLQPAGDAPPEAPARRIVTAVRTDSSGAITRFRQVGTRVWYDRDYELLAAGSTDGAWLVKGFVPETHEVDGSAPLLPVDLAPLWYARAGAMRVNGTGIGLAQVTLGMTDSADGSCTTTVKGYAHEESTGAVHAQDELPVHHALGSGTYAVLTGSDSRADVHITGFELVGEHLLVESLPGSTSAVEVAVDIADVWIAEGERASIATTAALPSPTANRWYHGWLWKDADGSVGFQLALDDAAPPDHPYRRVVTAVRTGPEATILPRFRQIGERVSFDSDVPLFQERTGTLEWREDPLVPFDPGSWGSAVLVPVDLAPLWTARGEVMRASGLSPGLGQITMGMLATNAYGAYSTQVKGFADTVDAGAGHGQDEVVVHHELGRGTLGHYLNTTVSVNVFVTGFRLATGTRAIIQRAYDSGVVLELDLVDVHVAGGQRASLQDAVTIVDPTPERWHYGWLWKDADGTVGFEARLDDAEPPDHPFRRIVTAFLVDQNGNIPSHRLVGTHVWFDGDYEKVLYAASDDGAWVESGFDQTDPQFGALPMIPKDVAPLWYTRSEVARRPEHGNGLGEIAFGMTPQNDASYATTIRGFAETEPPGSVFVNDELPVHHELGRGTFSYRVSEETLGSILFAGFEVLGAPRGGGVQCPTGLPDATCDGIDDDCDGDVDEDATGCDGSDTGADDSGSATAAGDDGTDGGATDGAATDGGLPGGATDGRDGTGGCSCRTSGASRERWTTAALVLLVLAGRRRRGRRGGTARATACSGGVSA